MRQAVHMIMSIVESPIGFIRQHDFQLSWRHAIYVSVLISVAHQAHQPFSSWGLWVLRVGLECMGWLIALAIISAALDFWAQYLGYRSKLKSLYASLALIAWPLVLYLPFQLMHPTGWSWVSSIIYIYIGIQAYQVIQHQYRLSGLKTAWLMALPGLSSLVIVILAIVLLIQSIG